MPSGPDEGRFFGAILDALGMPFSPRDRIATKQDTAVRLMRATKVRAAGDRRVAQSAVGHGDAAAAVAQCASLARQRIADSLVGVGTAEALRAIRSDDQLVNRFEPFPLPLWTDDDEYRRLLSTLEAVLPLRKPSHLADPAMAARILSAAEGVLGEIIAIVIRAPLSRGRHGHGDDLSAHDRGCRLHPALRTSTCCDLICLPSRHCRRPRQ